MHRLSFGLVLTVVLGILSSPLAGHAQQAHAQQAEARADYEVRIVGNQVLLDSVILWILDLPAQGPPTEQTAERAEARLEHFFETTGYDLARVKSFVRPDVLWVFVDEGVLEDIFVVGASTARTFNVRLELDLPEDVYNRIHVERQIERLQGKYDFVRLEAELVEVGEKEPPTDYLQRFVAAFEEPRDEVANLWFEHRSRYALKVSAFTQEWGTGFDFGASLLGPYGLRVAGRFSRTGLVFEADRYSVSAEIGVLSHALLTSAELDLFYGFPELFDESLRPLVEVEALLDSLDRDTLFLERYRYIDTNAMVAVGWEPSLDLVVAPGIGYGWDHVFGLTGTDQTPAYVDSRKRDFFVGELGLEWLISRVGLRRDKLHLLEAVLQTRTVDDGLWARFEGDYQQVWRFGDDDLFLRSNFFSFQGDGIEWYDEDPIVSQVMRAVAGDEEFARHLLAVGAEFRLALHRDIVQAGLSASGAATGLRDRQTRETSGALFAAGGPGLHIQLLDNFQLNLFYHLGVRATGETTGRFSLKFWKLY
jgi:hypothetical protein